MEVDQKLVPLPLPQAPEALCSIPPGPACTQLPLVKLLEEIDPITVNALAGLVLPIPTLPLAKTVNREAPVEEAIVNRGKVGVLDEPWTVSKEPGTVVPTPT